MSKTTNRRETTNPEIIRQALLPILEQGSPEERLRTLRNLRSTVMHLSDKGGIVVVADNDVAITAYRYDSYKRKH